MMEHQLIKNTIKAWATYSMLFATTLFLMGVTDMKLVQLSLFFGLEVTLFNTAHNLFVVWLAKQPENTEN